MCTNISFCGGAKWCGGWGCNYFRENGLFFGLFVGVRWQFGARCVGRVRMAHHSGRRGSRGSAGRETTKGTRGTKKAEATDAGIPAGVSGRIFTDTKRRIGAESGDPRTTGKSNENRDDGVGPLRH